jgi:membrane protein
MGTWFEFQRLIRIAALGWWNDRAMSLGASISFFTVFSLAPMLLAAISVAGLAFGHDAAQGAVVGDWAAFWARRLPKRSRP